MERRIFTLIETQFVDIPFSISKEIVNILIENFDLVDIDDNDLVELIDDHL